ncbi:hypothetical protein BG015_004928 [Linnemannia schmuckeri]|uniref:Uncharacterized protein n=1 Tax=Linnemannia schmuckeri TaxID=64567 RepID=A0A9P5S1Q7_9FUNG|nr:hypothetical protein BG015_004928 [Linnemannia schmuckeri]
MSTAPAHTYSFEHHLERYITAMRTLDAEIQELEELVTPSVASGQEDKDLARQIQERRARVQYYELGIERLLFAKKGLTATFTIPSATIAWPGLPAQPHPQ